MPAVTAHHEKDDTLFNVVRADALLDNFSALIEHAQALAFPPIRKGVTAPPDKTSWSRYRQIAFTVSSPWPTTFTVGTNFADIMLVVWGFVVLYWYLATAVFFNRIFGTPIPSTPTPEKAIWAEVMAYVVLVVVIALIPASYWSWREFLRDERYSPRLRAILTTVFLIIIVSSPLWLLVPEHRVQFPDLLLGDLRLLILFVATYLLFVIPQGTFYFRLAIDVLVLVGRLLWAVREYLHSTLSPFSKELVRKLVLEPFPANSDNREGRRSLAELPTEDLKSLREWAMVNREGTDKRLLPMTILFGLLGIFANTRAFSDFIDMALTWLYRFTVFTSVSEETSTLAFVGRIMVTGVVMALGMVFIGAILSLFRNLVTQSLIIEACIVSEHAKSQNNSKEIIGSSVKCVGFWKQLLRFLPWICL